MSDVKAEGTGIEWCLLQNQFDSYEKYSLLVKLANAGLLATAYFCSKVSLFIVFLLLTLWLQDAIWKTFQSRIETRLLQLEEMLRSDAAADYFQFNTHFLSNRPGAVALIGEYVRQALRPTVAFPHIVLVLLAGYQLLL